MKKIPDQIVVSLDVKRAIEDEATRLTRDEKGRVTQGDVVARAWKRYKPTADLSPEQRSDLNAFIALLKSGKTQDLIKLRPTLRKYSDAREEEDTSASREVKAS
jgi:hypothetical protein